MKMKLDRHIPDDFQRAFIGHLLINRAKEANPRIKANPILAIGGPSGVGKTSNTYALAAAMGCKVYPVQGSDLVAQLEGQGTELLIKALKDAASDETSLMPIVLVDDGDLGGLGCNPNISGTVNGEAIKGFVMGWADNPHAIKIDDGKSPQRIIALQRAACMIITTNRLDHLHPPMLGNQRANVLNFVPEGKDMQNVLAGLFPKLGIADAGKLMARFPDQPISFFASLKAAVATRVTLEQAEKFDGALSSVDWNRFSHQLERVSEGASLKALVAEGETITAQARDANFVRPALPALHTPDAALPAYTNGAMQPPKTLNA